MKREGKMNRELTLMVGGIGVGAALMYLLDPDRGKRRRGLVRDKLVSAAKTTPRAIGVTTRDLSNRARGLASEAGSLFSSNEVTDEVLVQRVRSKNGKGGFASARNSCCGESGAGDFKWAHSGA